MENFSIDGYPLVVEPVTDVLEMRVGGGPDELVWKQLVRVPTEVVLSRLVGLPSDLVHFFGVSSDLDQNALLIAYGCSGLLAGILTVLPDGRWAHEQVPPEACGGTVNGPSVRLVFNDEQARAAFLFYLKAIQDGKTTNPTLALLLSKLAEPPRVIDVRSP